MTDRRQKCEPRVNPVTYTHTRMHILRGEYAERRKTYDIIFRFCLKMEYPQAYKWNIIEYPRIFNDIPFRVKPG